MGADHETQKKRKKILFNKPIQKSIIRTEEKS